VKTLEELSLENEVLKKANTELAFRAKCTCGGTGIVDVEMYGQHSSQYCPYCDVGFYVMVTSTGKLAYELDTIARSTPCPV
jgi:hypothetical protein